jgi:hypothetical protein
MTMPANKPFSAAICSSRGTGMKIRSLLLILVAASLPLIGGCREENTKPPSPEEAAKEAPLSPATSRGATRSASEN